MPKQVLKIESFHGGINDNTDPRDIADNQLVTLENVAIDEVGKIVMLSNIKTVPQNTAGTPADIGFTTALTGEGRGFLAISTDYDGFLADTVVSPGQSYYIAEDASGIIGMGHDGETAAIAVSPSAVTELSTYYVNGALRIAEADTSNTTAANSIPRWRGYVSPKVYGSGSNATGYPTASTTVGVFSTQNAEVAGCFPPATIHSSSPVGAGVVVAHNAVVVNAHDSDGGGQVKGVSFNNLSCDTGSGAAAQASTTASTMTWGAMLQFTSDANTTAGDWTPNAGISYRFYITTMYDSHTQESLPQIMTHWDATALDTNNDYVGAYAQDKMTFTNGTTHDEAGLNHRINLMPQIKLNYDSGNVYNFGAATSAATSGGNPRISGVRYYWSSSEDGFSNLWRIFDVDFTKGIRSYGIDGGSEELASGYADFLPYADHNGAADSDGSVTGNEVYVRTNFGTYNKWTIPPKITSYEIENGHPHTDVIKVDQFKTAVLSNRRVYLGNVRHNGELYSDRMLKSSVGQYDKFPESVTNIDVITHDGDDIVLLMEHADRILQFKNNTLYIINVAGQFEFLEAQYKHKGLSNPGAACKTDYGIAWANTFGCYLYDGEKVTDLLESKGINRLNKSDWEAFIGTTNHHRVGFNPFKREIVVKAGTASAAAYIYSLVTGSWSKSTAMITDPNTKSNFINDPEDGGLMILDEGGNKVNKWIDTKIASDIVIKTKDFDFGQPAIRKKIYKVYVTYRGDGTNVEINYGKDGLDPALTFFITGSTGASTGANAADQCLYAGDTGVNDWTKAELKPAVSINNVSSFQLKFGGSSVAANFAINDISIVYRLKNLK